MHSNSNSALLQLDCRHHVYKLACGAVSEFVLGKLSRTKDKKTTALFKKLCPVLNDTNTDSENSKNFSRILLRRVEEAKQFLKVWLEKMRKRL